MLQKTLEQLTEEGKRNFLKQLVDKVCRLGDEDFEEAYQASLKFDVNLGAKYLYERHQDEKAVSLLEEHKKYLDAAKLCKELCKESPKWKDRAVENFLLAKETKKAVEVYLGVDDYRIESTEIVIGVGQIDHIDELEKLEQEKNYSKAAEKARNLGMIARAAKNLKLSGKNEEAEELLKNSNPLKAAQVWERKRKISEAVNLLFRNELYKEIPKMEERIGDFLTAGISYYWNNDSEKALECYRKAKYNQGITHLLMQLGRTDELLKHWEEINDYLNLANHFKDKEPLKAAKYYDTINNRTESALCLFAGGKRIEAVNYLYCYDLCEDAIELSKRIEESLLDEVGLKNHNSTLNKCYERLAYKNSSNSEKSLFYYEKLRDKEKVKELALKLMKEEEIAGNFTKALEYSRKAEDKNAEEFYSSIVGVLG